ncbi:uncharacterized protein B0T23DRAFT_242106 [Neurospora hispaniola]|uniref:Prp 4 CRoW domain-containing protein n=1 Tax=Neurospora hispaniola TaxID=588809 RepID=A0AAJ0HZH8_9PEZI|nr:hypothetical protein B0T23DRAFT_242106 [Neurospora hispaniola]
MHVKSFTALAALALAAQAVAEPIRLVGAPYKAASKIHKTSARQLFGVVRRQDNPGYQPEQTVCGTGNTCAEACGAGFEACASKDDSVHCYNAGAAQICCPNGSGNSCDAGYYCAADAQNETWCCPEGMSLEQCAAAYKVDGSLVSQTAEATSTSTSSTSTSSTSSVASSTSTSSTVVSTTSTSSVVVSTTSTSSVVIPLTTSSVALTTSSAPAITVPAVSSSSIVLIPTGLATGGAPSGANGTSVVVVSPQPTQSEVAIGAGSVAKPAGAFLLVAAGLAALL